MDVLLLVLFSNRVVEKRTKMKERKKIVQILITGDNLSTCLQTYYTLISFIEKQKQKKKQTTNPNPPSQGATKGN